MKDDLKNKSNEELKDIMRNSINNQYVPSSIYHKAKQELEFRHMNEVDINNIRNSNISVNSSCIIQTNSTSYSSEGKTE